MQLTKDDRDMLIATHEICKDMKKALFGNGQPGLVSRASVLETKMDEHMNGHRQPKSWPVVLSSICSVGALLVAIIVACANSGCTAVKTESMAYIDVHPFRAANWNVSNETFSASSGQQQALTPELIDAAGQLAGSVAAGVIK